MKDAFGSPTVILPDTRVIPSIAAGSYDHSDHVVTMLRELQTTGNHYGDWATVALENIRNGDTTEGQMVLDSLMAAVESWNGLEEPLLAMVAAAYDTAFMVVPDFDSIYHNVLASSLETDGRHIHAAMAFTFFLLYPNDTAFASTAAGAVDSSIVATDDAYSALLSTQEALFMTGAIPVLSIAAEAPLHPVGPCDTFSVSVTVTNDGSGVALDNTAFIAVGPDLELLSNDSIGFADLVQGDSVTLQVQVATAMDWANTEDPVFPSIDLSLTSASAVCRTAMVTVEIQPYRCGDIDSNNSEIIDISDLFYLINYMFTNGPRPTFMGAANVDGSVPFEPIDIGDIVYLVDYMFLGGPAPSCCITHP